MKKCVSCGEEIDDGALKCPKCGEYQIKPESRERKRTVVNEEKEFDPAVESYHTPYVPQPSYSGGMAAGGLDRDSHGASKSSFNVKIFVMIIVIAAVAAAAVYFIMNMKEKGGYETRRDLIQAFVDSVNENDVDKYLTLYPKVVVKRASDRDAVESYFQIFNLYDYKITDIVISEEAPYTSAQLQQLNQNMHDRYTGLKAEDAYRLTVTCSITATYNGVTKSDRDSMQLNVMQINGHWFAVPQF